MVEVAVRDEDGVEFLFRAGRRTIQRLSLFAALKEAAIDKDAALLSLHVISRPSDFAASSANCSDFHGFICS
jgi:hypothetical protein